ncbi:MAG: hypothetical protein LQ346_007954 [Caloplaca aetnensis]|nr:MAG: hypothetical protein LQ346_007954 [Caloplaca aetnensis]
MSTRNPDNTNARLPTSTSSLLLPTASLNFSKTVSSLGRSSLSISNRLSSINHDALFVRQVAEHYKLPVIANERCGSWYTPPEIKAGSAYFKSTDGHQGQWSFSTRRLNVQVLDLVGRHGGCVIVDSTRRGKSMPDALSKTVPIWCAVMNRLLLEEDAPDPELFTPEASISRSEHSQIEARLDRFVKEARDLQLPISPLRGAITKPLHPVFVTPASPLPSVSLQTYYCPIVCLTASSTLSNPSHPSSTYIQGAADDSESWSHGLTPSLFWQYKETLLAASEDELPNLIHCLLNGPTTAAPAKATAPPVLIRPTQSLYIAPLSSISTSPIKDWDAIIICAPQNPFPAPPEPSPTSPATSPQPTTLHLPCPQGKPGSRALRTQLGRIHPFIDPILRNPLYWTRPIKILCTCPTGTDLSVGAALLILCQYADEEGKPSWASCGDDTVVDKALVRRRLAWITTSVPEANPSRETLQALNVCMMSPLGFVGGRRSKQ